MTIPETRPATPPTLVAAAHGTRDPGGPVVLEELLDQVRAQLPGVDVRIAYVDVIGPMLDEVLAEAGGAPVVVPMFLASGYHVRVDVPDAVETTGGRAVVTSALGPDDAVVAAVADRLREASGDELPDSVVLAAAGSSDESALGEVEAAAAKLSGLIDRDVVVGYITTATPTVEDAVESLRVAGHERVGIATYLLAPGLFLRRLDGMGADVVAPPIGVHPSVVDLVADRYRAAVGVPR
ncbi:sirohydrochlorin chelatase [Phytoactinopolyspora halotolerans]|uniref:sirohydrochlorin chelatase n=1 Tax=Phytoactinopolyspora halotolerans TaxID=1981512 RepID=UPI001C2094D0|nr:CbiX/SirB N-terminal domain-containing protein [Phytoactinopolyspora halotolerans]